MKSFARLMIVLALIFWFVFRALVGYYWPIEYFATNLRVSGPPVFTVSDDKLTYGADGTPRVYANWLAHRDFNDDRTVEFYRDSALGESVCFLYISPPGGFRNRKAGIQPERGYSLDRWTNSKLAQCNLVPGKYTMVTTYHVEIWGGLFKKSFSITSNTFELK